MLHQLYQVPHTQKFVLACSGGVDSMAIADFYSRGNKNFLLAYFNHGTIQSKFMQRVVEDFAKERNIEYKIGYLSNTKPKGESPEEFWRKERYGWLESLGLPVITCHHLDDVVETWIFSSLNGNPKLISGNVVINGTQVIRPFILNRKSELVKWCVDRKIYWLEDDSNKDTKYPRNRIRHNLMPEILKVSPGIHNMLKRKILKQAGSSVKKEDISNV